MKNMLLFIGVLMLSACGENNYFSQDRSPNLPTKPSEPIPTESHAADCDGPEVKSIHGPKSWNKYSIEKDGKFTYSMSFSKDGTLVVKGVCEYPKATLEVTASTSYRSNENLIEVIESAEASVTQFGNTCDVSVKKAVLDYSFHGSCMNLYNGSFSAGTFFAK